MVIIFALNLPTKSLQFCAVLYISDNTTTPAARARQARARPGPPVAFTTSFFKRAWRPGMQLLFAAPAAGCPKQCSGFMAAIGG